MYIGLTGLIGSGKSTVSKYLAHKGAYIIDADEISRLCTEKGGECYDDIIKRFGKKILLQSGEINRKALSEIVFYDKEALTDLNSIVHPVVEQKIYRLAEEYKSQDKNAVIVFDVPLLIEIGMHKNMDEVWVVAAEREIIIERAMKRSGLTRAQAEARINNQMPVEEKIKYADVIIDNSSSKEALYERLDALFERIKKVNV